MENALGGDNMFAGTDIVYEAVSRKPGVSSEIFQWFRPELHLHMATCRRLNGINSNLSFVSFLTMGQNL